MRAKLGITYGALFRNLKLTPAQIAAFEDAIVLHEEQTMDIYSAAPLSPKNIRHDDREWSWNPITVMPFPQPSQSADQAAAGQLLAQEDRTFQDAITAVAGAEGYSQYQSYEQSLPLRDFVNTMNSQLSLTANPLDPEQTERLTQILENSVPSSVTTGDSPFPNNQSVNWSQVLEQAQPVLSPAQYQALQKSAAPAQAVSRIIALVNGSKAVSPSSQSAVGP